MPDNFNRSCRYRGGCWVSFFNPTYRGDPTKQIAHALPLPSSISILYLDWAILQQLDRPRLRIRDLHLGEHLPSCHLAPCGG